jgi:peptidyl-dipeptidase Dcp
MATSFLRTALLLTCAAMATPAAAAPNPFAAPSTLPFQAPPFDKIKDSDYQPAFEQAMAIHLAEVRKIADNPAAPTFDNTIAALEASGRMLDRVSLAFGGVVQANTNDVLDKVQTEENPA